MFTLSDYKAVIWGFVLTNCLLTIHFRSHRFLIICIGTFLSLLGLTPTFGLPRNGGTHLSRYVFFPRCSFAIQFFFRISIFHHLSCKLPCHLELSTFYLFFPHLPVSNWLHFSDFPQPIGCVSFIYWI